jgi:hypothetical protein
MSGILELVYSFIMHTIEIKCMMSETGDEKSKENEKIFMRLRTINKVCKLYADRLDRYLCPDIQSSQDSEYWAQTVPNVRNLRVSSSRIVISLKNVRRITFYRYEDRNATGNRFLLNSKVIQSWDWSLLEYLAILKTNVTESQIAMMSCKFPHLKGLRLRVSFNEKLVISNFLELKEMRLDVMDTNKFVDKSICITNLPNLTRCNIGEVYGLEFRNVPNLIFLESFDSSSIVFHDDIECVETIIVGDLYEIDPLNHVKWGKVKNLSFGYTNICQKLCLALQYVKSLRITKVNADVPDINWSNLKHLTDLLWEFPLQDIPDSLRSLYLIQHSPFFDLFNGNTMKNLKDFTLQSKFPIIVDCQHLSQVFPCIQKIRLVNEKNIACSNFESLFQISTLESFTGECHRENEIYQFWKEHPEARGMHCEEIQEVEEEFDLF